jgi:hypothetical protein
MDTPHDSTGPDSAGSGFEDPDAGAGTSPASSFPGAGERVGEADREDALEAQPEGNATVGDMVDTDAVDSRAHEDGPGSDEVADAVEQPSEESVEDDD